MRSRKCTADKSMASRAALAWVAQQEVQFRLTTAVQGVDDAEDHRDGQQRPRRPRPPADYTVTAASKRRRYAAHAWSPVTVTAPSADRPQSQRSIASGPAATSARAPSARPSVTVTALGVGRTVHDVAAAVTTTASAPSAPARWPPSISANSSGHSAEP